jgi:4-alpha-glucanotransferase
MVRIDHFRGLQACWQIPDEDETAINGSWVDVPGDKLLQTLFNSFDHLPLIAEDLGVITEQVTELKESFNLSGMKVLQFAFDGNTSNPHLPHMYSSSDVVYTGTHDNDTTLGWAANTTNYNSDFFDQYTNYQHHSAEERLQSVIRLALSSVAFLTILPLQDILMLDSSARMNVPGTVGDNWHWRFKWDQLNPELTQKISKYMMLYQR